MTIEGDPLEAGNHYDNLYRPTFISLSKIQQYLRVYKKMLDKLDEMFIWYYMHSDVLSMNTFFFTQ